MNKIKFEKKCQELIEHEDKCLDELNEFVKPYNEKLKELGCEIIVRRFWHYITKKGIENHGLKRLKFEKRFFV